PICPKTIEREVMVPAYFGATVRRQVKNPHTALEKVSPNTNPHRSATHIRSQEGRNPNAT
ncbi:hypothetical protein PMAYCL1PPCAC_21230, partial [Pristionchus mayeri]